MRLRRAARTVASGGFSERDSALTLQAASLLLAHPDEQLLAQLPLLAAAGAALPDAAARPLLRVCDYLERTPLAAAQQTYVDTFDLRRRCCLYLTYFSHGDTRKRGMALLRFSHAYRAAGARFRGGELPDHLTVVCEFAATTDLPTGLRLLAENRPGLELLRTALADAGSPYTDAVDAVRAVLGEPAARDVQKALELGRTGPPEEEVGLEPFGPPELSGGRR